MAEIDERFNNVTTLYSVNYAGLRFRPGENLENALWSMIRPESKLRGAQDPHNPNRMIGQAALFLYSHPQSVQKQRHVSYDVSPELDSQVSRHIKDLNHDSYRLAKTVVPVIDTNKVGFQFSILPDVKLQRQLHACYPYGLNETLFGRKAIEATFWLPFNDVVGTKEARWSASQDIKRVIWGYDDIESGHTGLQPPERGGSYVHGIEWINDMKLSQRKTNVEDV